MKNSARTKEQLLNDLEVDLFLPPSAMKKKLNRKMKDSDANSFKAKQKKPARKSSFDDPE